MKSVLGLVWGVGEHHLGCQRVYHLQAAQGFDIQVPQELRESVEGHMGGFCGPGGEGSHFRPVPLTRTQSHAARSLGRAPGRRAGARGLLSW